MPLETGHESPARYFPDRCLAQQAQPIAETEDVVEKSVLKALLEEGITAAQTGQKERACQCLMQVVKADENNEQAWLWLSGVVESLEDKQTCLENVLALNPDSGPAKKGMAWIAEQWAERGLSPTPSHANQTPVTPTSPGPEPSPPPDFPPAPLPTTPAILSTEGQSNQVITPPAQPPPAPTATPAPAPAVLYERRRKRESRSGVLWGLSVCWGLYGLLNIASGGLVLFLLSWMPTLLEHPDFDIELRPDQIETLIMVAEEGSPWGLGFIALGVICIALAVGLLMRLKEAFYASFVMAVLSFGVFFYLAIAGSGGCCCWPIAPIIFFGLTLFARHDFAVEEVAVGEERVEYPPGSPAYYYSRGAVYAKQKKLDLAIQEWERAVELEPDNIRFLNALALAYAGQGQREKAVALLEETLALAPDDDETKSNLEAVQRS
jgi:tetratricopeptide (TPR) repeat protein